MEPNQDHLLILLSCSSKNWQVILKPFALSVSQLLLPKQLIISRLNKFEIVQTSWPWKQDQMTWWFHIYLEELTLLKLLTTKSFSQLLIRWIVLWHHVYFLQVLHVEHLWLQVETLPLGLIHGLSPPSKASPPDIHLLFASDAASALSISIGKVKLTQLLVGK